MNSAVRTSRLAMTMLNGCNLRSLSETAPAVEASARRRSSATRGASASSIGTSRIVEAGPCRTTTPQRLS